MDPLTITGIGFTAVTVASLLGLHLGKVKVPRVGRWKNPPDVYVYSGSAVDLEEVSQAISFWARLGFEFGSVHMGSSTAVIPGAIVIGPPSSDAVRSNGVARAEWLIEHPGEQSLELLEDDLTTKAQDVLGPIDGGYIRQAYIGLQEADLKGLDKVRVVAHELGHALGFLHLETALLGRSKKTGRARLRLVGRKSGHLMHPNYSKGGWGDKGLRSAAGK